MEAAFQDGKKAARTETEAMRRQVEGQMANVHGHHRLFGHVEQGQDPKLGVPAEIADDSGDHPDEHGLETEDPENPAP